MYTKTIPFLGTFFGSSDPTSDQDHTMSCFDGPKDDPFADFNEEEHRLGLLEQQGEEQEPDWEQLLPSVDDEAQLASLFEGADQPDKSHEHISTPYGSCRPPMNSSGFMAQLSRIQCPCGTLPACLGTYVL